MKDRYWTNEHANFGLKGVNHTYVSLIYYDIHSACRMEIIGNIYDNPELVESTTNEDEGMKGIKNENN